VIIFEPHHACPHCHQVLSEPENPVLSALLVAEDFLNLSRRQFQTNNARYAALAHKFTQLAITLCSEDRKKSTTALQEMEMNIVKDRFGADAVSAFSLTDPNYNGDTALFVAVRSQIWEFCAMPSVRRVLQEYTWARTYNVRLRVLTHDIW
jgi:hypothetical protein